MKQGLGTEDRSESDKLDEWRRYKPALRNWQHNRDIASELGRAFSIVAFGAVLTVVATGGAIAFGFTPDLLVALAHGEYAALGLVGGMFVLCTVLAQYFWLRFKHYNDKESERMRRERAAERAQGAAG